ncbi:hypothetical protein NDU88_003205, partial [Pleurodeles waltl]
EYAVEVRRKQFGRSALCRPERPFSCAQTRRAALGTSAQCVERKRSNIDTNTYK